MLVEASLMFFCFKQNVGNVLQLCIVLIIQTEDRYKLRFYWQETSNKDSAVSCTTLLRKC